MNLFRKKQPKPDLSVHNVIIVHSEYGAGGHCSCQGWSQNFACLGPLPMWARAHIAGRTGEITILEEK